MRLMARARSPIGTDRRLTGAVYLNGETEVKPGDLVKVKIEETDEYDLWARPIVEPAGTVRAPRQQPRSRLAR